MSDFLWNLWHPFDVWLIGFSLGALCWYWVLRTFGDNTTKPSQRALEGSLDSLAHKWHDHAGQLVRQAAAEDNLMAKQVLRNGANCYITCGNDLWCLLRKFGYGNKEPSQGKPGEP